MRFPQHQACVTLRGDEQNRCDSGDSRTHVRTNPIGRSSTTIDRQFEPADRTPLDLTRLGPLQRRATKSTILAATVSVSRSRI